MFQILGLFGIDIAGFVYSILAGIYSNVAKIYDIMIGLVEQPDKSFMTLSLGTILDVVYVMAGVFMLFRVMVAMIQYFLNPDQVSDSSSGGGKLITRVIISIVLLIALQPTGFILGDSGLLRKIERAVLADDGVITRIIEADSLVTQGTSGINGVENILIDDVYADSKVYSCYYYKVYRKEYNSGGNVGITISDFYRIDFSTSKTNNGKTFSKVSNSDKWYFYSYGSNVRVGGENGYTDKNTDKPLTYTKLDSIRIKGGNSDSYYYKSNSNFSTCPKAIIPGTVSENSKPKYPVNKQPSASAGIGYDYPNLFISNGLYGGTTSVSSMMAQAQKFFDNHKGMQFGYYKTNVEELETTDEREEVQNFLNELEHSERSLPFAQTMAGTFIDCSGNAECETAKGDMFESSQGNKEMVDYIDQDIAVLDWFTGAIVGIALIIYLLILCIDIIVRRLKLVFMEVLSPIPVVSYVDPKDKMFNTWFKMYISIYVDLFIKLIAMALLINLLDLDNLRLLWGEDAKLLVKFFYIVAILVFAKLVPGMLSKVLGIEANGGSFKDIIGMAKGAAGFGAGAALGGAVGFASGLGKGGGIGRALTGMGKGAVMGAGSGAKGKIFAGAENIRNANVKAKAANRTGSTALGRFGTNTKRFFGQLDDYESEKNAIVGERLDLDREKYETAREKEMATLPYEQAKAVADRRLAAISAVEKKVESNFDKGKYTGKGIQEVEDYNTAVNRLQTLMADRQAGKNISDDEILNARNDVASAKGKALDASKDYEIRFGTDNDAQANLGVLRNMGVSVNSFNDLDTYKKTSSRESIRLGGEIESIKQSYVATEQEQTRRATDLAERERINENSAAKANHDAVGKS